jgi:hypothetical protein
VTKPKKPRALILRYGVPLNEGAYRGEMLLAQGGCAICGGLEDSVACLDHDHSSGEVRGVLCSPCNLLLGLAKDSPERLLAAAEYLRGRSERASLGLERLDEMLDTEDQAVLKMHAAQRRAAREALRNLGLEPD